MYVFILSIHILENCEEIEGMSISVTVQMVLIAQAIS
jgi:hypothetical protein